MKCPKCGYHGFDHLESCKKCGGDLREHKRRFGLAGFIFTGRSSSAGAQDSHVAGGTEAEAAPADSAGSACLAGGDAVGIPEELSLVDAEELAFALDPPPAENGPVDFATGEFPTGPQLAAPGTGCSVSEPPIVAAAASESEPSAGFFDSLPATECGGRADLPIAEGDPAHAAEWAFVSEGQSAASPAGDPSSLAVAEAPIIFPSTVPLPRRLVAGGIDLLILGLACLAFVVAGESLQPPVPAGFNLPKLAVLLDLSIPYFLVFFTLAFGYFTLFHFLTGQTPGKMLQQIRVEATDGAALLFSQAFLRSVGGLLSLLAAGVGFLLIFFNPERRGWNDRLADSRVVAAGCREESAAANEVDLA